MYIKSLKISLLYIFIFNSFKSIKTPNVFIYKRLGVFLTLKKFEYLLVKDVIYINIMKTRDSLIKEYLSN